MSGARSSTATLLIRYWRLLSAYTLLKIIADRRRCHPKFIVLLDLTWHQCPGSTKVGFAMGCERYLFKSVGGSPKSLKGWCVTYPVIPCFESFFLEGSSSPHVDEQTFTWKSKFFLEGWSVKIARPHKQCMQPSNEKWKFFLEGWYARLLHDNQWLRPLW